MKTNRRIFLFLSIVLQIAVFFKAGISEPVSGTVSLVPGKSVQLLPGTHVTAGMVISQNSIQLLPGTRITAGGFIYASAVSRDKSGKSARKAMKLVTVEENEKIIEQRVLEISATLISPFLHSQVKHFSTDGSSDGNYSASVFSESALLQDPSRKLDAMAFQSFKPISVSTTHTFNTVADNIHNRIECRYVLRL